MTEGTEEATTHAWYDPLTDLLDDARSTWQEGSDFDAGEWAAEFIAEQLAEDKVEASG